MGNYIGHSSFLNGANATFVAELYSKYLERPDSVDPEWGSFFSSLHDDARELLEDLKGASWAPRDSRIIGSPNGASGNGHTTPVTSRNGGAPLNGAPLSYGAPAEVSAAPDQVRHATLDSIRALMLIRAYRVRGHLEANLDPLGLMKPETHPELNPRTYGFGDSDMDRPIFINYVPVSYTHLTLPTIYSV